MLTCALTDTCTCAWSFRRLACAQEWETSTTLEVEASGGTMLTLLGYGFQSDANYSCIIANWDETNRMVVPATV
jgi:hypothetical protein